MILLDLTVAEPEVGVLQAGGVTLLLTRLLAVVVVVISGVAGASTSGARTGIQPWDAATTRAQLAISTGAAAAGPARTATVTDRSQRPTLSALLRRDHPAVRLAQRHRAAQHSQVHVVLAVEGAARPARELRARLARPLGAAHDRPGETSAIRAPPGATTLI